MRGPRPIWSGRTLHGNQQNSARDLGQRVWPEYGQVVVAIVNMTSDRFDLVAGDCVGSMANSVFEANGGIHQAQ
jgi:hypothetical protein